MSTKEQQELREDTTDVEEFICHLYPAGTRVTYCRLPVEQDAHAQMHRGYGQKSPRFYKETGGPDDACPSCGAPVCETCRYWWNQSW